MNERIDQIDVESKVFSTSNIGKYYKLYSDQMALL